MSIKIRASAEELFAAIEAVSERLSEKMGEDAFQRHFPELANARKAAVEEGGLYDGSGKFGFNASI